MKVVQVCPMFPYYGGVERHVAEISRELERKGIEVEIYATDPEWNQPEHEEVDGFHVFRFRSIAPNYTYFFAPKLYLALKELKDVDIVHAHTYQAFPSFAAALAKRTNMLPLVFTPHFHPVGGTITRSILNRIYRPIGQYAFKQSDVIIALSDFEKRCLSTYFKVDLQKIVRIPNGIDTNRFQRRRFERKDSSSKTILYVGRLEKYKGVQYLLQAIAILKKAGHDICLVVVGTGPYKKALLNEAFYLELADCIKFQENITEDELLFLYQIADVFVLPSQYEAFSLAVAEAMSCEVPVVATNVGGIPFLIKQNETGLLIDYPPNPFELSRKILKLLDVNSCIGRQARQHILSYFPLDQCIQRLIEVYEKTTYRKRMTEEQILIEANT